MVVPSAPEKMEPRKAADPPVLYPNLAELNDYMGLSLSSEEVQKNLGLVPAGSSVSVSECIRERLFFTNPQGCICSVGVLFLQGLFVQLVKANSPASLVGLRFGDQILQIDGKDCAGWNTDKAKRALKKASPEKIVMVIRDRPFQRTVTMHKDGTGHVGFVVKKGQISSLVKGSSAARNGLLINHYICEVNGQNVIGMKDKEITNVLMNAGNIITLTIVPAVIYEHMIKK
ncbi:hypothetical protein JD844_019259 [Phrynosoma platyrhinos]|uniref:PDZ domain-containing protein n=1 Tax=Phrynosoma platyrhinos TaxID=52577 RepID=A0ABQ7SPR2_PHRPL|nr:hypothetical protein JD844_019259 [Phrynosoma platyrhinos]